MNLFAPISLPGHEYTLFSQPVMGEVELVFQIYIMLHAKASSSEFSFQRPVIFYPVFFILGYWY